MKLILKIIWLKAIGILAPVEVRPSTVVKLECFARKHN